MKNVASWGTKAHVLKYKVVMDKTVRILLVEDSQDQIKLISRSFIESNKNVLLTVACDLNEAFSFLEASEPDLVITDCLLPSGSGLSLLPGEQKNSRYPVIILSSQENEQTAIEALKSGALDYIVKSDSTLSKMPDIAENALREWSIIKQRKIEDEQKEISHDSSDFKVEERMEELVQANQELKAEIEKYKKVEKQLIVDKKEADEANKAKSEFFANLSHELRTPLHAVLSYSRFGINKIDKIKKEKILGYFEKIETSAKRLEILLTDLLDLSKMESGRMVYQMHKSKIMLIIKTVVSKFHVAAYKKNQTIEIKDPDKSYCVVCDQNKIEQVISHLISNAIKFSPENEKIVISVEKSEIMENTKSIPALKVIVTDNGIGIPEKELELVFEKYIRSTKTKTGAGGKGLGLAVSYEIIKFHGGKLWAENNPEKGANFNFLLPFNQDPK